MPARLFFAFARIEVEVRWKFRREMPQVVSYESDPPFRRKVTHLS